VATVPNSGELAAALTYATVFTCEGADMRRLRSVIVVGAISSSFVVLLLDARAGAQAALVVRTLEVGGWAESIAAMQLDASAQGQALHVVVDDSHGERAPCGTYRIALDAAGSRAFTMGACDGPSAATELVLVDRSALFVHDGSMWRPRQIGIAASELRLGSATGGAAQPAGAELECSLAVRPYLVDLLSGEHVRATPDRFVMRPVGEGARVTAEGDGWTVRAGSMHIEYELVDRTSGEIVLHDTAELACGREVARTEASDSPEAILLFPGRVFRGATLTRGRRDERGTCGGGAGPEQWYVVRLDAPTRLGLRLVSEFDATLYVREGAIDGPEIACRDQAALLETFEMNLDAGTYYVAVDGTGTHGRYRLISFEDPPDPHALDAAPRGELVAQRQIVGELLPAVSRYHASCGGEGAPEHVYALRIDRPTYVAVRLASRFDAALYLLALDGAEIDCRSTIGMQRITRHSQISAELPPGLYFVVVDGESQLARPGGYRIATSTLPLVP
jgi:hypothetical protein